MIGPQRPVMAIHGVHEIQYLEYQGKRMFLFSDATHGYTQCSDARYQPRIAVEKYLYQLSKRMEAALCIEGTVGKNIWLQQPASSHMENVNHLFHASRVNHFEVHAIDERFTDGKSLDGLVQGLMNQFPTHSGIQPLFDIASMHDSSAYKRVVQPIVAYLMNKYKFNDRTVIDAVLDQNYQDIAVFYAQHKKVLHHEQRDFEQEGRQIPPVLYEFMAAFFMFLVDLTLFIHLASSKPSTVFVYLGSQHIHNIVHAFNSMGIRTTQLAGPSDGCIAVDRVNAMLHVAFQGARPLPRPRSKRGKKNKARKTCHK